jgi:hypothetical protein
MNTICHPELGESIQLHFIIVNTSPQLDPFINLLGSDGIFIGFEKTS